MDVVDLNHGSGFVYGIDTREVSIAQRINVLIDAALVTMRQHQPQRDYLGASRLGEPCARRLAYEITHTPLDDGHDIDGAMLRVFEAGHRFEELSIEWLRAAGFDLRTQRRDGSQFGFTAAGGRLRGHIDGVIVAGPDIGVRWPALWEHKALNAKSWNDIVKRGLRVAKPLYFAQVQLYMAYMEVGVTLFTALNKDSQALLHEVISFEPREAQALSDKAVDILRAVEAGELPPRIAAASDFYLCRSCPYARRCWEGER
jgi:PD-(D/E)XK nuclease superfamily